MFGYSKYVGTHLEITMHNNICYSSQQLCNLFHFYEKLLFVVKISQNHLMISVIQTKAFYSS